MTDQTERQKKAAKITSQARVTWATSVFDRIKSGERVPARDLEKANAILMESASASEASIGAEWAMSQVELANILGVERKTIQRWLKIIGCPKPRSDGRFNVTEFREWAAKTGRKTTDELPDDEKNRLEVRRLRTICERLDLELEIQRGSYTDNEDVKKQIYRMIGAARKVLGSLPARLAPVLVGATIPDAEARLREAVDDVMKQLHEGDW